MKQKSVQNQANVLILSDSHSNHIGGLLTPQDDIIPNPGSCVNDFSKQTYPIRRKLWDKFMEQIGKCNMEFDAVILLGELIDLPHKRNAQNTVHPNAQNMELVKLFINVIKFLPIKKGATFYGCLGSRFHVTMADVIDVERECYAALEREGFKVNLNFCQKPVDFAIFNHVIRAWHKITGSAEKNIEGNLIKQATNREIAPNIIFSGHWHKGETYQKQYMNSVFDFIKCPCLCLPCGDLTRLTGNNEKNEANYAIGFRTLTVSRDGTICHKMYSCECRGQRTIERLI